MQSQADEKHLQIVAFMLKELGIATNATARDSTGSSVAFATVLRRGIGEGKPIAAAVPGQGYRALERFDLAADEWRRVGTRDIGLTLTEFAEEIKARPGEAELGTAPEPATP